MTTPPDWDRILANAVRCAENAEEGTVTFAAMSSNPVRSMYLTTQEEKDDGSGLREYGMHIVGQPPNFPETPRTMVLMQREGYRRYLTRVLVDQRQEGVHLVPLSIGEWRQTFMSVISVIDEAIRDSHAVMCFEDGDFENKSVTNIFYLHVCDIMNVYMNRLDEEVPVIYLPSPSLVELKLSTRNMLTDRLFNSRQLNFFTQEIDFLYNSYAYFANYSFVPIRTLVEHDDTVWKTAGFYTHDNHFREHQEGKLKVIARDQSSRNFVNQYYRTP
jgi:hypothetical protein